MRIYKKRKNFWQFKSSLMHLRKWAEKFSKQNFEEKCLICKKFSKGEKM
jgi:hypothetical protein